MKKGYYKYWWFNSLIIASLFGYSLYEYAEKINIKNAAILDNYLIDEVQCSTDRNSSVIIVKGTKLYNIPISWKECRDFSKGDSIAIYYSKERSYLFYEGKNHPRFRAFKVAFISILLLLSVLPLKYFTKKLMKAIKNSK